MDYYYFNFLLHRAQTCDGSQHNLACDNTNVNINGVNINTNQVPMTETQQLDAGNRGINGNTENVHSLLNFDKNIVNISPNANPVLSSFSPNISNEKIL